MQPNQATLKKFYSIFAWLDVDTMVLAMPLMQSWHRPICKNL